MSEHVPDPAPRWLTQARLQPAPSAVESSWLFDQSSLTLRLTELSRQRFNVQPLLENWQILRPDETTALGIAEGSPGWVREVFLYGNGEPWVFARSVAARSTLEGSGLALETLGSRSLGELLFNDSAFMRGELQVTRYPAAWLPEAARSEQLWARRSCFRRSELAVLVVEVFLPGLWRQNAGLL